MSPRVPGTWLVLVTFCFIYFAIFSFATFGPFLESALVSGSQGDGSDDLDLLCCRYSLSNINEE